MGNDCTFLLYTSLYELFSDLPQESKGTLLDAIFIYARDGEVIDLPADVKIAFRVVKQCIDRDKQKYKEKCDKRKEAGDKGGAPLGNSNAKKNKQTGNSDKKQPNACFTEEAYGTDTNCQSSEEAEENGKTTKCLLLPKNNQMLVSSPKQPDNDNDNDNDNNINSSLCSEFLSNSKFDIKGANPKKKKKINSHTDVRWIMDYWNEKMEGKKIPSMEILTPQRKAKMIARLKQYGEDNIKRAIDNASESAYLNGDSRDGWVAGFEWIFKPVNFPCVMEGHYNPAEYGPEPLTEEQQEARDRVIAIYGEHPF